MPVAAIRNFEWLNDGVCIPIERVQLYIHTPLELACASQLGLDERSRLTGCRVS